MQLLTYGERLLDKTNSVRTCVTYGRTLNGQTELLQYLHTEKCCEDVT